MSDSLIDSIEMFPADRPFSDSAITYTLTSDADAVTLVDNPIWAATAVVTTGSVPLLLSGGFTATRFSKPS